MNGSVDNLQAHQLCSNIKFMIHKLLSFEMSQILDLKRCNLHTNKLHDAV